MSGEPAWMAQARAVSAQCVEAGPGLLGVYVHGSAALGGFTPASDLDMLVVSDADTDWAGFGRDLLRSPATFPIELSVIPVTVAARARAPWTYRVHVAAPATVSIDRGDGDPDLIAHCAVTRQSGIAVVGPRAREVFGRVERAELLEYFDTELAWGLEHGDERYAVLNACRAAAYARDGVLRSKIAGGRWWVAHIGGARVVEAAMRAQERGIELGPASPEARAFVESCRHIVRRR